LRLCVFAFQMPFAVVPSPNPFFVSSCEIFPPSQ